MVAPLGHPSAGKAWARAHLRRGSSPGQIWEISADYPEARLTLGIDPGAGWRIEANGVRPIHCELFWDGKALWVADIQSVGGVFLDGARISGWTQIQGPAELRFGQAALDIETSAPLQAQMHSRPELARPVTVTEIAISPLDHPSGSAMFGGAAGDASVPGLDAEKTRLAARAAMAAEPMRLGVPAPGIRPDLRPRLGGAGDPVPHAPDATKMVALPGVTPGAPVLGAPAAPPPLSPPRAAPPAPLIAPPPAPPAAARPPPPPPTPPAPASPPAAAAAPAATGGFAPPPAAATGPEAKPGLLSRLFGDKKPSEEAASKQSLPARTWILLSVTVLAAVGLLLWEEDAPPQPTAPTTGEGPVVDVTGGPDSPAPPDRPATPDPDPPEPIPTVDPVQPPVEPVANVDTPSSEPGDESEEPVDVNEDGVSWQRMAADAYLAGRYEDALREYRRLSERYPEDDAYGAMVRVLESRLRARCVDGRAPGGGPCEETP